MLIYHERNFAHHTAEYNAAMSLFATLDWTALAHSYHCAERADERAINLGKISERRFFKGELFEIKVENDQIISIGINVNYNKKYTVSLIIGFMYDSPLLVTAWLNEKRLDKRNDL